MSPPLPIPTRTTRRATFTASINWGDGTPTTSGSVSGSNGNFTVSGGHTYADEGSFPLSVTITDTSNNKTLALSGTVAAAEADVFTPQGITFTTHPGQAFSGTIASFTDTYAGNTGSDFTATIDWGDGSTPDTGTITFANGAILIGGTHTYANPGYDTVTVTLTDDAPGDRISERHQHGQGGAARRPTQWPGQSCLGYRRACAREHHEHRHIYRHRHN